MSMINPVSLEEVNQNLLERLNALIDEADTAEEMLKLTESIAKLNASFRNNDQFMRPETADERAERESREALTKAINGQ